MYYKLINIFEFLSKKSVRQFRVKEYKELSLLFSNKLFFYGLFIRFILIIAQSSEVQNKYFLPFISSTSFYNFLEPWTKFIELGGDLDSFPYGIVMFLFYTPLTKLGIILGDLTGIDGWPYLGLGLTTLFFDSLLLVGLAILLKTYSKTLILKAYWFSPIVLYVNYFHGQLDVLPICILIWGLCFLQWKRPISSGILFGLSISAKFSMLVAIPFVIIYLLRNEKIKSYIFDFLLGLAICLLITVIPYIFSEGYKIMVLNNPKQFLIYELSYRFNENLQFYFLPAIYFAILYLIWNIKSITLDLFLISIGIGFLSIILFIPASPGWYFWVTPFLTFYQIRTNRLHNPIIIPFYLFYLTYSISYFEKFNLFNLKFFEELSFNSDLLLSLTFSLFQTFSILICISMYLYGIKRNNYYKAFQNPNIIGLTFNKNNNIINSLVTSINNMLGDNSIINLFADNYKTKNFNYLSKSKISKNNLMYDYSLLINDLNNLVEGKNIVNNNSKNSYMKNYKSINTGNNIILIGESILDLSYIRKFIDFKIAVITEDSLNLDLVNSSKKIKFGQKPAINNAYNEFKSEINKNLELFSDLLFILTPVNKSLDISKNEKPKIKLIVKMRNSYICQNLVKALISSTDMHIEFDYYENNQDFVKLILEGECSGEDIFEIANFLIPNLEDLIFSNDCFSKNYMGLMQLIVLIYLSELIHLGKLNKINV